jgi:hypothetical protein
LVLLAFIWGNSRTGCMMRPPGVPDCDPVCCSGFGA